MTGLFGPDAQHADGVGRKGVGEAARKPVDLFRHRAVDRRADVGGDFARVDVEHSVAEVACPPARDSKAITAVAAQRSFAMMDSRQRGPIRWVSRKDWWISSMFTTKLLPQHVVFKQYPNGEYSFCLFRGATAFSLCLNA